MTTSTWRRRLGKRSFPDPVDEAHRVSLDELMRRVSPGEREELAGLRERLDDGGRDELTDMERERLRQLAMLLQDKHDDDADRGVER